MFLAPEWNNDKGDLNILVIICSNIEKRKII